MEKKLNISNSPCQYKEIEKSKQHRGCGAVSISVVLNYFGVNKTPQEVFDYGEKINGLTEFGWKHMSLCKIARDNGVNCYPQEFRSEDKKVEAVMITLGIEKIKAKIDSGIPTIVSVHTKERITTHLIVVVGYSNDSIFISDPEVSSEEISEMKMEEFIERWRRLAIFFEKW